MGGKEKEMKKFRKVIFSAIISAMVFGSMNLGSIKASESEIHYDIHNVSESMEELTPYITVENNQFVLKLPENVTVSSELQNKVQEQLNGTNTTINVSNYVIDSKTKTAHPKNEIQTRKYGKNALYIHWNYLEFWLDAGLLQTLYKAGAAGAITAIVAAFPPIVAFIAAHPIAGLTIAAIVSSVVDSAIGFGVKNGLIVHYNFYMLKVTKVKYQ